MPYSNLPMSRGAQIANVLNQFYQTLREKEAKKRERAEGMENLMLRYNMGQEQATQEFERQKELLGIKAGQERAQKEWELMNPSNYEKAQADYLGAKGGEEMKDMEARLREQISENQFLRQQAQLNRTLAELEKQEIVGKFSGKGVPQAGTDDYDELVKRLQNMAKYYQTEMETYKTRDDDVSKKAYMRAQTDLETIEQRLSYLQKLDPANYIWATMPQETPEVKEEKPGLLSRTWGAAKQIPGEAKKLFERQEPITPKAGGEAEPVRPQGLSSFSMYYRSPEWWKGKEAELDYLMRYVLAHKEDKKAMRKFQKLKAAGLYND